MSDNIIEFPDGKEETVEDARERAESTPMTPEVFYTFDALRDMIGAEFIVSVDCRFITFLKTCLLIIDDEGTPNVLIDPEAGQPMIDDIIDVCVERGVHYELDTKEES
jgi:hypothetical protein